MAVGIVLNSGGGLPIGYVYIYVRYYYYARKFNRSFGGAAKATRAKFTVRSPPAVVFWEN